MTQVMAAPATGRLSRRIQQLSESQTIKMSKMGRDLAAKGFDVISLSLGEPDFITPEHIRNAAKEALDKGRTFYTPISGLAELRKALSEKFKRENNLAYSPEQIVVSNGAKQSIFNAVMSLVDPGDEVIIPQPYWVSYIEIVKLAEGKTVFVPTGIESDFKITAGQLRKAITPKTRMMIFSSPCNPTGSVYSKEELSELAAVIAEHPGLYVISDEIYERINFVGRHVSIAEFENIKDRTIVVNGMSKGYAMTGWRIGYIGAPLWIAQACDKVQGQVTSGASSISQWASVTALSSDASFTEEMRKTFLRRRDLIIRLLREIPGLKVNVPQGAFYVFPDVSVYFGKSDGEEIIHTSSDLCIYLLSKAYVSTVPGEAFGAPDCIRLSYATSEEKITEAVKRIKEALDKLK